MNRRRIAAAATAVAVLVLAALYAQKKPADTLLVQEWAAKSSLERPPVAVLIEFGSKDLRETDWSGRATVAGGRVVHREGYQFRPKAGDKLADPDGWEAKSHRPLRAPAKQPAISKMEPLATVGIVLHLADVKPDASVTIEPKSADRGKATVPLKGVLAGKTEPLWDGLARVRLISAATPVAVDRKTENDFPAACYGPDGSLWVAYVGYHIQDEARRIEQKPYREQPKDFGALYTPEFHDQVFARRFSGGKWSQPIAVTDDRQDAVRCTLAAKADNTILVAYAAGRGEKFEAYQRRLTPGAGADAAPRLDAEEPIRNAGLTVPPVGTPAVCTDSGGGLFMVCPSNAKDGGWALTYHLDGEFGRGEHHVYGLNSDGPFWGLAVAAGPGGRAAVAFDRVEDGDYDLTVRRHSAKDKPGLGVSDQIASTRFEARPSICYDGMGRLWVAYEEGPELWG
ncbi:MAG TPA: hypothetical protein VKD90_07935, partial [Gemmataceae bacterium]|nr:hypothetical protein [Gemmataceae bacterium]